MSPTSSPAARARQLRGESCAEVLRVCFLFVIRAGACHSNTVTANAAALLKQHYVDKFRRLPWRSPPGGPPPDPYKVWLSEIMLQQTTVATVVPRFERFVARWPTIEALASAGEAEILSEWAGLGYYARARNLIACAREVARRGGFPRTAAELAQLPGIGAYTSAAIAAIAFGEDAVAVDTNVERVIARLHGLARPRRAEIERLFLSHIPGHAGDFLQALMDLGATVCRPTTPRCAVCPIRSECAAYASGDPEIFPRRRAKKRPAQRYGVAYWAEGDEHVWLVRRAPKGLLGGMAALPGGDWSEDPPRGVNPVGTIRHTFTHFTLDLHVVPTAEPVGEGWWHPFAELDSAGLPTLYRKAAQLVLGLDARLAT